MRKVPEVDLTYPPSRRIVAAIWREFLTPVGSTETCAPIQQSRSEPEESKIVFTRNRIRSSLAVSIAAVLIAGTFPGAATADEAPSNLTADAAAKIDSYLESHAVPFKVREELIAKADAGVLWDNVSGVEPITTEVGDSNGVRTTVTRYPDGSVSVEEVSLPQETSGGISVMNVGQCVLVSSSSYHRSYSNCFISRNDGIARASFRHGYTVYNGAPAALYGSPNSLSLTYYVGSYSGTSLRVIRSTATSSLPAVSRAQWTVSVPAPTGGTYTGHLEFKVSAGGTLSSGYRL